MRICLVLGLLWSGAASAQADPDPWLGPDKALHFAFSAGIAAIGYGGTALFTEERGVRIAVGAGLALTAGIGKELLDLAVFGRASWKDLAWDVAGTAVGVVLSWLVDVFIISPLVAKSAPPLPAH